MRTAVEEVL